MSVTIHYTKQDGKIASICAYIERNNQFVFEILTGIYLYLKQEKFTELPVVSIIRKNEIYVKWVYQNVSTLGAKVYSLSFLAEDMRIIVSKYANIYTTISSNRMAYNFADYDLMTRHNLQVLQRFRVITES